MERQQPGSAADGSEQGCRVFILCFGGFLLGKSYFLGWWVVLCPCESVGIGKWQMVPSKELLQQCLPSLPVLCSPCKFKACSRYGLTFKVHMKRRKESWKRAERKTHLEVGKEPCPTQPQYQLRDGPSTKPSTTWAAPSILLQSSTTAQLQALSAREDTPLEILRTNLLGNLLSTLIIDIVSSMLLSPAPAQLP